MTDDYATLLEEISQQPEYRARQQESAKAVYRILAPLVKGGHVREIWDFGCGDGLILSTVARRFADSWAARPETRPDWMRATDDQDVPKAKLRLVGVDKVVTAAEDLPSQYVALRFERRSISALDLPTLSDASHAAILVLGHTLLHFATSVDALKTMIGGLAAAAWLVDFHETWDAALGAAKSSDGGFDEAHSVVNGTCRLLRTTHQGGATVTRELVSAGGQTPLLSTQQLAADTTTVEGLFTACGYLRTHSAQHFSGWGPMESRLFVACGRDQPRAANEAFYQAVKGALGDLFVDENQTRYEDLRRSMKLFQVRCAAVILPFDSLHTFSRYAPVTADADQAPEGLLILEEPTHDQETYPTAYGLYSCILGHTSTMQVFPLPHVVSYEMARVDEAFAKAEQQFFDDLLRGAPAGACAPVRSPHNEAKKKAYFLLPVYFGTLPLFVLVLQFGETFPEADTGPGLYRACLASLHDQLRRALLEDQGGAEEGVSFLRVRIIRPFLETLAGEAVDALRSDFVKDVVARAREKPWKSWVTSLPANPIRKLRRVQDEDKLLSKWFDDEVARIERNVFWHVSRILQQKGFFGGPEHDDAHEGPIAFHIEQVTKLGTTAAAIEGVLNSQLRPEADEKRRNANSRVLQWAAGCLSAVGQRQDSTSFFELKAALCRETAANGVPNAGTRFRFSAARLWVLAKVAAGREPTCTSLDRANGFLTLCNTMKCCPTEDPSDLLWETLIALRRFYEDKEASTATLVAKEASASLELSWPSVSSGSSDHGGFDGGRVRALLAQWGWAKALLPSEAVFAFTFSATHESGVLTVQKGVKVTG